MAQTISVGGPAAPVASAPERLAAGDVVDGVYRVERLLGLGGHGAVYLVGHQELGGARFALKVVHARSGAAAEALVREGRLAAQVQSAHVVKVTALGRLPGGAPYLVMEYVDGPTLDELVLGRTLAIAEAIDCGRQLCLALEAAHAQGLVHGDVSLRNLFATAQPDGSLHLQLGDFGLVRRVKSDPATTVSIELEVARGTPRFMAPELIAGGDVDGRGDLFSVGVVLYRLLAGVFPFDGATSREVFTAILRGQPQPLERRREQALAVAPVVMRCLELDPAHRFDSARALREALDVARTAPLSRIARPRSRLRRWGPRLALVALAIAAAVLAVRRWRAPPEQPASPVNARRLRLASGNDCLTAMPGVVAAIGLAPCERHRPRADQTWLLEADALGRQVRDLAAAGAAGTHLRTLDGRCLGSRGFVTRCDQPDTRVALRRRFMGNLWTVESTEPGVSRCLRHDGAAIDWLTGDECDAGPPPMRWVIEDVIAREETTTITIGGRCLGLPGDDDSSADGVSAELRDCAAGPQLDERWQITPVVENGVLTRYVQLHNALKGGCLEVGDIDVHDVGSGIGTFMCGSGTPDRDAYWIPVEVSPTERRLQNRVSGLYLTIDGPAGHPAVFVDQLAPDSARQLLTAPAAFWPVTAPDVR